MSGSQFRFLYDRKLRRFYPCRQRPYTIYHHLAPYHLCTSMVIFVLSELYQVQTQQVTGTPIETVLSLCPLLANLDATFPST